MFANPLHTQSVDAREVFLALNKALPLPRLGMLREAYFYDALLARSEGDYNRMRRRLQSVIETQQRNYIEYFMAKFLLAEEKPTK